MLVIVLVTHPSIAADFQLGDAGGDIEFTGGGLGREVATEVGTDVFGFLIVKDAFFDKGVYESAAVLGAGNGAGTDGQAAE